MPLRQTILNFYKPRAAESAAAADASAAAPPTSSSLDIRHRLVRTPSASSTDGDPDTIVITTHAHAHSQLPTPSESSLDVTIQEAKSVSMKHVPKGRARRVNGLAAARVSQAGLLEDVDDENLKNRSVSGETLVNIENASQSTLVKEGIAALNLPWSMSEVFGKDVPTDPIDEKHQHHVEIEDADASVANDDDHDDDEEELRIRTEKAAARKARAEENNRAWEERRRTAEKNASRRSSRVPVLDKASAFVSNIASSVLGKRKDRATDEGNVLGKRKDRGTDDKIVTASRRSLGAVRSLSGSIHKPDVKKRRVTGTDAAAAPEAMHPPAPRRSREKRWLTSGLYAGQSRAFDGRLNESKNKRKSSTLVYPPVENRLLPLPMYAGERLLKHGRDFKLPFDIFSPLPAGQPKPDEWRKVNKNVFVGDAAQSWRVSKFEEHSSCMCKPDTGCDHNCMNRYMYYECDERNCNLTADQCGNRAFEGLRQRVKKGGKYNIGVEVIKTEDRGYGVRSNRTFAPNQIIVEYTGEIITQEECEQRMRSMYKDNECYYLMLFDQNMIIDATRGSIARFVNHSCDPNCKMEKWTVGGKPRMALFAGDRGIMTGEELSYDYNFDPYSQKNVQECRCGADNCRGVLGPRSKDERKQRSPDDDTRGGGGPVKLAATKNKIARVIEKTAGRVMTKTKAAPKAKMYKSTGSSPAKSPIKVRKIKVTKRAVSNKTSATAAPAVARHPSKLKKIVTAAKGKTVSSKTARRKMAHSRVLSTASSAALIAKKPGAPSDALPRRSTSLRERASSVRSRVVRTVRGGQSGQDRTIRPVVDEMDEMDETV